MSTATENGIENPLHRLTPEQIEAIGKEFEQLHDEVFDDLGDRDARYIRSMIELHRRLALLGRVLLVGDAQHAVADIAVAADHVGPRMVHDVV